jgi:hypothetical protein
MAKSDPDSNGLRQDQPEWLPGKAGRVLAGMDIPIVIDRVGDRSGVTKLSRLTSDPICYGGPQGWDPHFLRTP